jgi:ATP synthase protein I
MDRIPKKEEQKPDKRQSLNALARYSGMAFQIAGAVVICLFLGKWLDSKFPMNFPVFTTILTILGVFLGVYFVIRDLLKHK